jgi:formylglycine-generating enzyme required for sulfatase activity
MENAIFTNIIKLMIVLVFLLIAAVSSADVFNMGTGLTSLEFVMVGNPGNEGELSDPALIGIVEPIPARICGAVDYMYKIGKYEITNAQYCDFLNAVASSDPYNLYDTNMGILDEGCGIIRSGNEGSFTYSVMEGRANIPVKWVSFYDACRFVNWLHNGQGNGDTETGAYTITPQSISENTITRNSDWRFAVTSEDEWYKAAYHKNDGVTGNYWNYPTGSDTPPTAEAPPGTDFVNGSANWDGGWGPIEETDVGAYNAKPASSAYGTFDQGGNAWEMLDTITVITGYGVLDGNYRGLRGGEASSNPGEGCDPEFSGLHSNARSVISGAEGNNDVGFRISARSSDPNDVDIDGDGYTENQGDCDDGDDMIYPGGPEICGDGIDQDCSGSDEACSDTDVFAVGSDGGGGNGGGCFIATSQ